MYISKIVSSEIKPELKNYKIHFKSFLKSDIRILDIISDFVHYQKKSEIIPALTILTSKIFGEVNESIFPAIGVIDLLYTATLIHDDVEDEPIEKKGLIPIKTLWKSKLSILMGDYFLAKGLLLSVEKKSYNLLEIVSNCVKEITEGELYKIYHQRSLNISKEEYLHIISKNLPALFSACTTSSSVLSNATEHQIEKLQKYGYCLGMAAILSEEVKYLKSKKNTSLKISFPLICALEKTSQEEQSEILKNIASDNKKFTTNLKKFIDDKGGIEATIKAINEYKTDAKESILWIKESNIKSCLISLIEDLRIS